MTEEQFKQNIKENENSVVQKICDILKNHEKLIALYLSDFVASLCDIEKEKMFAKYDSIDAAQARWMFWYAYRYMTNETYEKIGKISKEKYGRVFTVACVSLCIGKMNRLIEQQPIWGKRWAIIKRAIREYNSSLNEPLIPITIKLPKNVTVTIEQD